ncbi:putative membrane protein [Catenuloplanes nepalensis]|uniref:Membrane protein n=1 Tax=Catenuloplanes nepalensis TaxID=587533 RepID=A0ABT9N5G5_9ACTN|nr:DUF2231 domain-containing protein [Catenuloplanes nepalensis]MDP9798944.1 putative membrane protein [Catenuloplanes nepalensis]
MESRLKVSGHSVHLMLFMLPMGLFVTGIIFDLFHLMGGPSLLAMAGYWQVVGGLFGAAIAGLAGIADLLFLQPGTRARRVAIAHGLINGGVLAMFAVVWLVRVGDPERAAGAMLVAVELLILLLGAVAAWLAGELVEGVPADGEARPATLRSRAVQAIGAFMTAR